MDRGDSLQRLMEALRCLPGVGPRSAQRMAFHLLQQDRDAASRLHQCLGEALEKIRRCRVCRTLTEDEVCGRCCDPRRDRSLLCVVETPADVLAVDQATVFQGLFFVLHGHLSPLDGVGPEDLGLDRLERRLAEGEVKELILATNSTVEGEATAHYIAELARRHGITVSRIAHGVPVGGELEYLDANTLAYAFEGRRQF
ncbi:recombination protein RecR [Methylomarinovum tepidoasis]|uniref:Recombination protein RecR n=1 Tax=Methylomarinovum tepidoasis TaxID=2840183 RepID=A0AAU9C9R2_9GAMM|nr:recombination mediator RecR [Methylomarinovum sp. IN45]BCX89175.1 recombination protein RecR [Methylomarinovum sp. IN45]